MWWKRKDTLQELVGKECRVSFNLPFPHWPFEGNPAWLYVFGVEQGMIKLGRMQQGYDARWVSLSIVREIDVIRRASDID